MKFKKEDYIKTIAILVAIIALVLFAVHSHTEYLGKQKLSSSSSEHYDDIVYVSKSGKIHDNPNCSGMKYYKEMDYDKAISRGYVLCQNCY